MDVRKTGFMTFFIVVTLMLLSIQESAMGFKEFKVGGDQLWHVPNGNYTAFYEKWAASKRFHVGDSLRFEYKNDSVLAVDKYGYYHCDPSKATTSFNDGNTTIKLEHPGPAYFISGTVDHCIAGQHVQVDVMSPHPHPIATPPEAHHEAEVPAPGAQPKRSGSPLVNVAKASSLLGLVVVASLVLV